MSCGAALLPDALPVAGAAAGVGPRYSSGAWSAVVAPGVGSCVARGAHSSNGVGSDRFNLSRSRFSLDAATVLDARCMIRNCTANVRPSANSIVWTRVNCADLTICQSTPATGTYQGVVSSASNCTQKSATGLHGRSRAGLLSGPLICRQVQVLLEYIWSGQPALCMGLADRSARNSSGSLG